MQHVTALSSFLHQWSDHVKLNALVSDLFSKATTEKEELIASVKKYIDDTKEELASVTDDIVNKLDEIQQPMRNVRDDGCKLLDKGVSKLNKTHSILRKIPGMKKPAQKVKRVQERLEAASKKLSTTQIFDPEALKKELRKPLDKVQNRIFEVIDKHDNIINNKIDKIQAKAINSLDRAKPYLFVVNKMVNVLGKWPNIERLSSFVPQISNFLKIGLKFKHFPDLQSGLGNFISRVTPFLDSHFATFRTDWKNISGKLLNHVEKLSGKLVFPGLVQNLHSNVVNCLSKFPDLVSSATDLFSKATKIFDVVGNFKFDKLCLQNIFLNGLKDMLNFNLGGFLLSKVLEFFPGGTGTVKDLIIKLLE